MPCRPSVEKLQIHPSSVHHIYDGLRRKLSRLLLRTSRMQRELAAEREHRVTLLKASQRRLLSVRMKVLTNQGQPPGRDRYLAVWKWIDRRLATGLTATDILHSSTYLTVLDLRVARTRNGPTRRYAITLHGTG